MVAGARKNYASGLAQDGLDLIEDEAHFTGPKTVEIALKGGGTREIGALVIVSDTGTRSKRLAISGADEVPVLDSTSIMLLGAEPGDERFLVGGFDCLRAVVSADPGDRVGSGMPGEDGENRQRCTGAPVAADAADFHLFPGAGMVDHGAQRGEDQGRVGGDAEVWPVEVIVDPRRLPPAVEIEPVAGLPVTGVGVDRIERHGSDLGAVGQADRAAVQVHFGLPVLVIGVCALGWLSAQKPVHLLFGACHDHAGLGHLHPKPCTSASQPPGWHSTVSCGPPTAGALTAPILIAPA